ncbi:MAG TPA: TlpA disulfide reductase family protein [Thermomicrobiales bacterium]|nr:TlpA disulfide reductase family protein [Thermomicrobiales bacterium]
MSGLLLVSYVALWALVVVMGVLLLLLYRHFGMMSLGTLEGVQRDGLSVGAVAPTIGGVTAAGTDASWNPKAGQPQLLMFVAPDCEPCAVVLPFVDRLSRSGAGVRVAAVAPGPRAEVARLVEKHQLSYPCLAEDGGGAFNRFKVRVTPFGFVISGDGRVLAKGLCSDQARLKSLLQAAGLRDAANVVAATPEPLTLMTAGAGGRG